MYVLASPSLLEPGLYVTHLKALDIGLRSGTHTTLHRSRFINPPSTIHSLPRLDTQEYTPPPFSAPNAVNKRVSGNGSRLHLDYAAGRLQACPFCSRYAGPQSHKHKASQQVSHRTCRQERSMRLHICTVHLGMMLGALHMRCMRAAIDGERGR
jgi:hypothetical protein